MRVRRTVPIGLFFPTAMQLGFNLWAWTWCNISRPRKSGTLGGGTGGTCGTRCPGTFAFLEPKEFLEPVEPVKRMGFHRFQAFLGFKHAMVPQVPHRFHASSAQVPHRFLGFSHAMVPQLPNRFLGFKKRAVPQVPCIPWVQKRTGSTGFQTGSLGSNAQWFHRFHRSSLGSTIYWFHTTQVPRKFRTGSTQVPWVQPRYGSTASKQVSWLQKTRGSTGSMHSLGSKTHWFHRVPDRFLGFKRAMVPQVPDRLLGFSRGTVGIVGGVNFGNCPKYVALNAPLCRTIFGMGGDTFLTGMPFTHRNHATGSTGSGSTGSRQVPWVQTRNGSTGSTQILWVQHAVGSTGSRQVPRVQQRRWLHRFHTGSLGLTTPWVQQVPCRFLGFNHATGSTGFQTGSLGWNTQSFHNFQTVCLGSTTPLIPQVPDRFLGFNRGTVGIVGGVNFGNCPNYVLLNAPLRRTILKWAGIRFWQECLSRIETTPLVPQVSDRFLGFNHATGLTGSRQVFWVQARHWFHRFQSVSLGSNTPLVSQVPAGSLGSTSLWVQQVEPKEPVWNRPRRWTVGIVEGVYHQTVVLFNVPLSINQQWEPWSLGNLVSHSSCLPIILEPCFLSFCLPSLCYYPFILALFIFLSSIIISSYCPPLSLHLVSLRLVSHPSVAHYVIPITIFSSCLPSSLHLDCPRASCLLVSCSPTSLCLVSDHPFVLSLSSFYFSPFCIPSYPLPSSLHPQQQKTLGFNLWKQSSRY